MCNSKDSNLLNTGPSRCDGRDEPAEGRGPRHPPPDAVHLSYRIAKRAAANQHSETNSGKFGNFYIFSILQLMNGLVVTLSLNGIGVVEEGQAGYRDHTKK